MSDLRTQILTELTNTRNKLNAESRSYTKSTVLIAVYYKQINDLLQQLDKCDKNLGPGVGVLLTFSDAINKFQQTISYSTNELNKSITNCNEILKSNTNIKNVYKIFYINMFISIAILIFLTIFL